MEKVQQTEGAKSMSLKLKNLDMRPNLKHGGSALELKGIEGFDTGSGKNAYKECSRFESINHQIVME